MKPALLIDASIYIFRYYFSLPDNWFSEDDYPTAAVYGYTTFLLKLLEQEQPDIIAAAFDESLETGFRHQLYPAYKSSRALPDEALAFQLNACREVTELLGITSYSSDDYEADDLLATLAKKMRRSQRPIAVLSRDKDLAQLILRKQDFLWDYLGEKKEYPEDLSFRLGVRPEQVPDYLALLGDSSDDIPGVPGVGVKTARQLLEHFGNIVAMYQQLESVASLSIRGSGKLAETLREHQEQVVLAYVLASTVDDIKLDANSKILKWRPPEYKPLEDFCRRMGFARLSSRVEKVLASI